MEEILKEIQTIKTQQLAFNNRIIENGKQNEMILVVLRELLSDLREEDKEKGGQEEIIEGILMRLDVLIDKLDFLI
jgi:hypothetical protein